MITGSYSTPFTQKTCILMMPFPPCVFKLTQVSIILPLSSQSSNCHFFLCTLNSQTFWKCLCTFYLLFCPSIQFSLQNSTSNIPWKQLLVVINSLQMFYLMWQQALLLRHKFQSRQRAFLNFHIHMPNCLPDAPCWCFWGRIKLNSCFLQTHLIAVFPVSVSDSIHIGLQAINPWVLLHLPSPSPHLSFPLLLILFLSIYPVHP